MIRFSIHIPPELNRKIEAAAKAQRIPKGALVRGILEAHLDGKQPAESGGQIDMGAVEDAIGRGLANFGACLAEALHPAGMWTGQQIRAEIEAAFPVNRGPDYIFYSTEARQMVKAPTPEDMAGLEVVGPLTTLALIPPFRFVAENATKHPIALCTAQRLKRLKTGREFFLVNIDFTREDFVRKMSVDIQRRKNEYSNTIIDTMEITFGRKLFDKRHGQ